MYMRQLSDLESTVSQLRSELRETKRMYEDKESLQNSPLRIWTSRSCHYWLCRFGFTLNFRFLKQQQKIYHHLDSKFILF
ncbi:rCG60444, isoform CRA_b [Rattus norvegicus]|uniref:RCG60444, isoform CRA_b n=2 Tax=Rattus norvegicus TaxID=10116 RepID=A6KK63_RAT|nr:rCG60444, isoform CRA_b [Rattus norvegicus]